MRLLSLFKGNLTLLIMTLISACTHQPITLTTIPVSPSLTADHPKVTPVESAFATGNSTAAPLDDIIASHAVTFDTPDGATITGELYGSGKTAVIFSVMGNCKQGWRELAQLTAAQGLRTLTYQWRGCGASGVVDNNKMKKFVDDLRGAITLCEIKARRKLFLLARVLEDARPRNWRWNPKPAG